MNKKAERNKKGMFLMAVGLVLITAALLLTGYNLWDEQRADVAAAGVLTQIYESKVEIQAPDTAVTDPDEPIIPDYILNPDMEMPATMIDENEYIGVLAIPALDLSLPVMSDWSYPKLKVAPGRYQGSAYAGNLIIAGHNYRKHFGGLKALSAGDEVIFTDVDGNRFAYAVIEIETLKSTETDRMEAGDWDLTLFTCTLGGENRVTVRCDLQD